MMGVWRRFVAGVRRHGVPTPAPERSDDLVGGLRMSTPVEFYWRPGCGFCSRLRADLRRLGLPLHEINIWEEPGAAATVRSITGGNETVPTVVVGAQAMVNPSAAQVMKAVKANAPQPLDEH